MLRPTRRRPAALMLAAAALVGVLAGCGLSPIQTTIAYDPSDGVSASVGDVQVRNLLVVGSSADAPGIVSGVLLNGGTAAVTVTLASGTSAPVPVDVPAGGSVQLGATGADPAATTAPGTPGRAIARLSAVGAPAGAVIAVTLTSAGGGTTTVQVPVVPPTNQYASLTPSAAPPSEGPTVQQSPTPSESPTVTPPSPVTPTPTAG